MAITTLSFEQVCRLVHEEAGILLEPGKEYLVESRLLPLARTVNAPGVDALVGLFSGAMGAAIRRQVVDAMTTNETSFFRDQTPFACLQKEVLPALVAARRAERALTIWCGASSTGQEPYSIAMLIREHFPELLSWRLTLLATDLSARALARAKAGRYNEIEINRGLPASYRGRYFEPQGLDWQVVEDVRAMVRFEALNLHRPWPALPPIDVALLRNVMIYFDAAAKTNVLRQVREALRPDGFLFLGAAETTTQLVEGFTPLAVERSGCHRRIEIDVTALAGVTPDR